jgi:hypothetical protein
LQNKANKEVVSCFQVIFNPEYGGLTFLQNVGKLLPDYMVSNVSHRCENIKSQFNKNMFMYNPLKVYRRFDRACCLHPQCRRISQATNKRESKWLYLSLSSLKMEVTCSSEASVVFQRITRRYIVDIEMNHRCEDLKSYTLKQCPGKARKGT